MKSRLRNLVAISTIALFHLGTTAARADWRPYEWLITVETEDVSKPDGDKDSALNPIVKAQVAYCKLNKQDWTKYENVWFCKGKTFGIERQTTLDIGRGTSAAIKISHKDQIPSESDFKAAAKSILKILLDVRLSGNTLQTVIVPDDSFNAIADELHNEHFERMILPYGAPCHLTAGLYLQNESVSRSELMYYAPRRPGS